MKIIAPIVGALSILLAIALPASGHQPRLVGREERVEVTNPEISQAFYATLQGEPHTYLVEASDQFLLYVSLLVPDLEMARTDFVLTLHRIGQDGGEEFLYHLDGKKHEWTQFYEPFGGDSYLEGPEREDVVSPGEYRIVVSNPDDQGKYVLSVGREESFGFGEMVATMRRMPQVKQFFEKSPWLAFFNMIGLAILVAVLILAGGIWGLWWLGRRVLKR